MYDDYQLTNTEKAQESMSANEEGYYVHMLTMKSVAERERPSRAKLARKRMIKAVYTVSACASAWVVSGGGNGTIMAGPDGATAPTLGGGERGYDRTVIRGARFQVD
jgi:hypothetical protein